MLFSQRNRSKVDWENSRSLARVHLRRHSKVSTRALLPDMLVNLLCHGLLFVVGERWTWQFGKNVVQNEHFHVCLRLFLLRPPLTLRDELGHRVQQTSARELHLLPFGLGDVLFL
jgi:hypothetical protein